MGIFKRIENSEPIQYEKLTLKKLKEIVDTVFNQKASTKPRQYIMYTGENGMWRFNWTLLYGDCIVKYNHIKNFNKVKGTYLSLFSKKGNYKLFVQDSTFKVYHGTKLLKTFTDVVNIWNANSGDMKDAPLKIKEVNDYINSLEPLHIEEQRIIDDKLFDEKMINLLNQ